MNNENNDIPIQGNELSSELIGLKKDSNSQKKKLISITIGMTICLILIIIIIIVISSNRGKKIEEKNPVGEINCEYEIQSISKETNLLSNDFDKKFNFDIYINGEKIIYKKQYQFSKTGNNNVKYIIYDKKIIMDKMFRNIPDITSIEMISYKNCEIISMISTFENCQRLINFNITGFSTSKLTSMKNLFYKTTLSNIDITNFDTSSVTDMSYMFASTEISSIDLTLIL